METFDDVAEAADKAKERVCELQRLQNALQHDLAEADADNQYAQSRLTEWMDRERSSYVSEQTQAALSRL